MCALCVYVCFMCMCFVCVCVGTHESLIHLGLCLQTWEKTAPRITDIVTNNEIQLPIILKHFE